MLDPQNALHKLLGIMLFRLPHNQQRWQKCLAHYLPILENAFTNNDAARLLVMKVILQIDENNPDGAQKTLDALRPAADEGGNEEKALWHILHALHQQNCDQLDKMAASLSAAHEYGHRFYLAHAYHAECYLHAWHLFAEAEEHFNKSIDCLYAYPPMTETTRRLIGTSYTGIADARTMMHRYEDAKDALRKAEQMEANPVPLLRSKALLHAALRQPEEANHCLSQLNEKDDEPDICFNERIRRILAEQDPHFTPLPIGSPEGIAEFWRYFLDKEEELQHLLRNGRLAEANELMCSPLAAMDIYEDDYWDYGIQFKDNHYQLIFINCFSRTYPPFIDALLTACPPEIRERWQIIRDP